MRLCEATTPEEILEVLARRCWHQDHDGDGCPDEMIPTLQDLADHLQIEAVGAAPPTLDDLAGRLVESGAQHPLWAWSRTTPVLSDTERRELEERLRELHQDRTENATRAAKQLRIYLDGIDQIPPLMATAITRRGIHGPLSVSQVHATWCGLPEPRPTHPLSRPVRAWQMRPVEVERNRHPRPIFPSMSIGEAVERTRGRIFGGLIPAARTEAELPLFPDAAPRPQSILDGVPLLALSDATGTPVTARGRGAPLDLAVPVEAILAVRPEDWRHTTVRIVLSIKELRDGLFPNGWERRRDWPRLQEVLRNLNTRYIPWRGEGEWYPLTLRGLPHRDADLDELVLLDLALPRERGVGDPSTGSV